ncbi:ankyrin, partial [Ophiobolus disseminans]
AKGCTTLHIVAGTKQPKLIDLLLEISVGVDVYDASGRTPLHWAARVGRIDSISRLLHRGASPRALVERIRTPFMDATITSSGSIEAIASLIRFETDRTSTDRQGQTALYRAAIGSSVEGFVYLLQAG